MERLISAIKAIGASTQWVHALLTAFETSFAAAAPTGPSTYQQRRHLGCIALIGHAKAEITTRLSMDLCRLYVWARHRLLFGDTRIVQCSYHHAATIVETLQTSLL